MEVLYLQQLKMFLRLRGQFWMKFSLKAEDKL